VLLLLVVEAEELLSDSAPFPVLLALDSLLPPTPLFVATVVNSGGNAISGELYEVNTYTLMLLDMLESNGVFYERTEVELESGHKAWLYFLVVDLEPAKDQSRVLTENKVQTWIMTENDPWANNPPGV
jgi:hypothetical protein